MKTPLIDVIYKFILISLLIISLCATLLSGLGLIWNIDITLLPRWHLCAAILLIICLCLHIIHRKNKFVKVYTQFSDFLFRNKYPTYCNLDRLIISTEKCSIEQICHRFQLEQSAFLELLVQGRIQITHIDQPLRQLFPHNDEKIFAIISLALQEAFAPYSELIK